MQTPSGRPTLSNFIAFVILGICAGLLMIMSLQSDFVRAQTAADHIFNQDKQPNPTNKYFFSEATPLGD